jgi:hypothetical protein
VLLIFFGILVLFCSGAIERTFGAVERTAAGRSSAKPKQPRRRRCVSPFCFAVLPQVRSNAPTCAIERSTRQHLRQFVSFSFYFWFLFSLVILIPFYFYSHVGRYSNTLWTMFILL